VDRLGITLVEEVLMSDMTVVELDLPGELEGIRFPGALDRRLQDLLDKQDRGTVLSESERQEAEALVSLAEMLSLLRARAERAAQAR